MKSTLTGYVCPTLEHLKKLNVAIENPLLVKHTWFLRDAALADNGLDIAQTPVGKFQAMPRNANNGLSYGYQSINVNTSYTILNFVNLPRCIELTLNINTVIQLVSLQKHCKYLIKINFNDYVVTNLANLITLPKDMSYTYFATNNEFALLQIEYVDRIYGEVLFAQPKGNLASYTDHTNNIIFHTNLWSDYVDSSVNAFSGIATGAVSYVDNAIALQNNRIVYEVDNTFNLNEVDFSIECFLKFENSNSYGSVISKWTDVHKQFWVRIDNTKTLKASFNEGVALTTLSYDLTSHLNQTLDYLHVLVTRTFNIYKLFLNGVLVDSKKSTPFLSNGSGNVVIGKLQNAVSTGDAGNVSFTGYIRELKITKSVKNNYPFYYVSPKNPYGSDMVFLMQNGLRDYVTTQMPPFVSTVATTPVLTNDTRRTFAAGALGVYNNTVLDKKHQLEYSGSEIYDIPGNVTIEGWIKNVTGNTRGTILYYGSSTLSNFHFGIYDSTLRMDAKNNEMTITGTQPIPFDQWTHVAYVRNGTLNVLYVNGLYAGQVISSTPLNFYGNAMSFCVKRTPAQNLLEAAVNTSLYPSKSHIIIESLRITKQALYSGSNTVSPNFVLPGEFGR